MCGVRVEGEDNAFDAAACGFATCVRNQVRMPAVHAIEVADSHYRVTYDRRWHRTLYKRDAGQVKHVPVGWPRDVGEICGRKIAPPHPPLIHRRFAHTGVA